MDSPLRRDRLPGDRPAPVRAIQGVTLLPPRDLEGPHAVRLDAGDPLVAPVVHAAGRPGERPSAPQEHSGVAGLAHVERAESGPVLARDQGDERAAATRDADPAAAHTVHAEPGE